MATGQVAALQDEIKRHELVYDMLGGRKTETFPAGSLRRDDRLDGGFATLPDQFTLDTLDAHKAANEKPRVCLRGGHTLVEGGSDQAYRSGHVPEDLIQKKLDGTDGAEVSPVQWKCLKTNKGQPP